MTADQFIWWLRGYLASGNWNSETIRDALDRVGPVQPPAPAPPPSQPLPDYFEKIARERAERTSGKCPRCNQWVGLGTAHFCNGVYSNG